MPTTRELLLEQERGTKTIEENKPGGVSKGNATERRDQSRGEKAEGDPKKKDELSRGNSLLKRIPRSGGELKGRVQLGKSYQLKPGRPVSTRRQHNAG